MASMWKELEMLHKRLNGSSIVSESPGKVQFLQVRIQSKHHFSWIGIIIIIIIDTFDSSGPLIVHLVMRSPPCLYNPPPKNVLFHILSTLLLLQLQMEVSVVL